MSAMTWPVLHNNPVQYNEYSTRYPLFGGAKTTVHTSQISEHQHIQSYQSLGVQKNKHLNKNKTRKNANMQPRIQISRTVESAVKMMFRFLRG